MRKQFALMTFFTVSASSFAGGLGATGVFNGALDDDFESYSNSPVGPIFNFLGGMATNTSGGNQDIYISGFHGLGGSKATYTSSQAMVANNGAGSTWTITFATPMRRIGGYWQSAFNDSYLQFEFFSPADAPTGTIQVTPPNTGELTWYGFEDLGGISKVIVTSDQPFQIVDNFTADVVPEPASMAALGIGIAAMLRRRKR